MQTTLAIKFLLIGAFLLSFSMTGAAQSIAKAKVTLGLKDESLETAIRKIEQQTEFRFFYRESDVRSLADLNLPVETRTIQQTLEDLLQNTGLSFRQIDSHILLERKDQQAPYEISGRVMDSTNEKPIANVSVFLNNSSIGTVTDNKGGFSLKVERSGRYELVVSIIGYASYRKNLFVDRDNLIISGIEIAPQFIALPEVKVKPDPGRDKNYKWFTDEFLGNWNLRGKCVILNPEILDFNYDKRTGTLTASAPDFLEIENQVLGYKIKYLLSRFSSNKKSGKANFKGSALFEPLKGDEGWQQIWQKNRMKTYKGSAMHFLRSSLENRLGEEGFKVLRLKRIPNPDNRNPDVKYVDVLGKTALREADFVKLTDKRDEYALSFKDCLYVMYTKLHNYTGNLATIPASEQPNYAKTALTFVSPYIFFDRNGIILNPESVVFEGYWAGSRVAELLPFDYEPENSQ